MSHLWKVMLDKVTKLLCPIRFGRQWYEALVPSSRQMCVHKSLMHREERPPLASAAHLSGHSPAPQTPRVLLPWQRHLARATSSSCQRIYKRKAKLLIIAAVMALQGNGIKQPLFRWQRYLLRGLQAGEQGAPQCVCICSSTLVWEMWGLDRLRVTSTEGLKLWHEKYLVCARASQLRSTQGTQGNKVEDFAQVFQVVGWSLA